MDRDSAMIRKRPDSVERLGRDACRIVHIRIFENGTSIASSNELRSSSSASSLTLGRLTGPGLVTGILYLRYRRQNFKVDAELPD
jgi:hypothetical protein